MKHRDEKFYWTCQRGVKWPDDYVGPDSMTRWIIETSQGFTDVGLLRISESVRAYAYLILSSQASARSRIIGNTASALTAQRAFLNNFENAVNPISTGRFYLVVALGGASFPPPSIKLDPDILEHRNLES